MRKLKKKILDIVEFLIECGYSDDEIGRDMRIKKEDFDLLRSEGADTPFNKAYMNGEARFAKRGFDVSARNQWNSRHS